MRQVIYKGHPVIYFAKRLGASYQLLYKWAKRFKDSNKPFAMAATNYKLAELRRTTEDRDILKKG